MVTTKRTVATRTRHPFDMLSLAESKVLVVSKHLSNAVGLLKVITAFGFKFFSLFVRVIRWGKDVAQTCGSSFFSPILGQDMINQKRTTQWS